MIRDICSSKLAKEPLNKPESSAIRLLLPLSLLGFPKALRVSRGLVQKFPNKIVFTGTNTVDIVGGGQIVTLDSTNVGSADLDEAYTLRRGTNRQQTPGRYDGLSPVFIAGSVITIAADAPRVTEGKSVVFTVSAEPVPSRPIEVTLDVRDSGHFARRGQTGIKWLTLGTGKAASNL